MIFNLAGGNSNTSAFSPICSVPVFLVTFCFSATAELSVWPWVCETKLSELIFVSPSACPPRPEHRTPVVGVDLRVQTGRYNVKNHWIMLNKTRTETGTNRKCVCTRIQQIENKCAAYICWEGWLLIENMWADNWWDTGVEEELGGNGK